MTRTELTLVVRRHNRLRLVILSVSVVAAVILPIANIALRLPAVVILSLFLGVPVLGFVAGYLVLRTCGPRCPHCAEYLGLEKLRFYDVTQTGRCSKCGKEVVDGDF